MSSREGFTLGELAVSLALLGLLTILLLQTLSAHQKVFRSFSQRIRMNEQLREAALTLSTDIRGNAPAGDTLRLLTDSAFEFFSTLGASTVCTVSPAGISLVPAGLSTGLILTSLPSAPDTGDLLAAYVWSDTTTVARRRWVRFRISSVALESASSVCPSTTGFTAQADAKKTAYAISLNGPAGNLAPGTPVRVLRRGRYSLYRSSDGEWYLGYKRCNAVAAGCSAIQPVSGPYSAYESVSGGGLRFRYLDALGAPVSPARPLDVASVEITIRAEIDAAGRVTGRVFDSAVVVVTPRNLH